MDGHPRAPEGGETVRHLVDEGMEDAHVEREVGDLKAGGQRQHVVATGVLLDRRRALQVDRPVAMLAHGRGELLMGAVELADDRRQMLLNGFAHALQHLELRALHIDLDKRGR